MLPNLRLRKEESQLYMMNRIIFSHQTILKIRVNSWEVCVKVTLVCQNKS